MLNLFKKNKSFDSNNSKAESIVIDSKEIVKQIHYEFDSAEERLLQDAKDLLEIKDLKASFEEDSFLLEELGFVSNKKVVDLMKEKLLKKDKEERNKVKTLLSSNILNMKTKYPSLKFLTINELNRICEKYGLIHASVKFYKEDVPIKNLLEIKKAPALDFDDRSNLGLMQILKFSNEIPYQLREQIEEKRFYFERGDFTDRAHYKYLSDYGENDYKEILFKNGIEFDGYAGDITARSDYSISLTFLETSGFFIAAPKKEFDMDKLGDCERRDYGYFDVTEKYTNINDPVVFRYCKGGVQVISKWGLEARDEALVNPIEN